MKKISNISYEMYLWMYPIIYISNKFGVQGTIKGVSIQLVAIMIISLLTARFNQVIYIIIKKYRKKSLYTRITFRKISGAIITILLVLIMGVGVQGVKELPFETDTTELKELELALLEYENIEAQQLEEEIVEKVREYKDLMYSKSWEAIKVEYNRKETNITLLIEYNAQLIQNEETDKQIEAMSEVAAAQRKAQREAKAKAKAQNVQSTNNSSTSNGSASNTSNESVPAVSGSSSKSILFYGDSVMLGAASQIKKAFPNSRVDAVTSRQVSTVAKNASSIFGGYSTVVLALGTNGTFTESQGKAILGVISSSTKVYWVDSRGVSWSGSVNSMINTVVNQYSNASVISWNSYSSGQSSWFYSDGIHLKTAGQNAYAQMLYDRLK